jgi:hypothetical protein
VVKVAHIVTAGELLDIECLDRIYLNAYVPVLQSSGIKFAVFYTKLHNRLLRPLMAADQAQAPPQLRQALDIITQHVDDYIDRARLGKAA